MIPLGYKQTEVGVVPEDWEVWPLSSLISYGPRNGYSGRSGKEARGTPTLALTATTSGRMILDEETIKHPEETLDCNSDILLKAGDVLVQRSNTPDLVGTTAIFDGPGGVYAYPDLMMRMRFKTPASSHWFWRYANSSAGRRYFVSVAAGSTGTMPKLSGDKLRTMPIPLPPLPEQRAIAEALSDLDELLSGLDRLIAKKRDLKQAAMQQLLTGQTRLPGFHGEWEETTLGQTCLFENGDRSSNYPSPNSFRISGIPFINAGHVADGEISTIEMNYITQEAYDRLGGGKVKAGDILFCLRGSLGKFGLVRNNFGQGAIASSLVIVRPKDASVSREYLCCYFGSTLCAQMIETWAGGAAQPNLGAKELARFSIQLPPHPEQTAIAEVLTEMDGELAVLEQRREKTRALKQAMMQELLTGRTRLT